jgi:hypothetical protein
MRNRAIYSNQINIMELNPPWSSCAASQEFSILWKPGVHYREYKALYWPLS